VTSTGRPRPGVDAGRLWAGGVATAVVAALVALLGVLLAQGALDIAMVEPPLLPVPGSFAFRYALTAGVLALLATALAHLLVSTAPRPRSFFSWIVGLTTAVGVVLPFTVEGTTAGRLATAVVDLVIGLAVMSLLGAVMTRARQPRSDVR
jgi:hypothetical protein